MAELERDWRDTRKTSPRSVNSHRTWETLHTGRGSTEMLRERQQHGHRSRWTKKAWRRMRCKLSVRKNTGRGNFLAPQSSETPNLNSLRVTQDKPQTTDGNGNRKVCPKRPPKVTIKYASFFQHNTHMTTSIPLTALLSTRLAMETHKGNWSRGKSRKTPGSKGNWKVNPAALWGVRETIRELNGTYHRLC